MNLEPIIIKIKNIVNKKINEFKILLDRHEDQMFEKDIKWEIFFFHFNELL
jgi:hypothetical protein